MRRVAITAIAAIAAGCGVTLRLLGIEPQTPEAVTGDRLQVRVVGVVDGDTLRAETLSGVALGRVRLLGIDAPELTHPPGPGECYAQAARRQLEQLLPAGSTVVLVADPEQPVRDDYGRLLRYADRAGSDVSIDLLAAGAARVYPTAPELARIGQLRTAAARAQTGRMGLWDACPDAT